MRQLAYWQRGLSNDEQRSLDIICNAMKRSMTSRSAATTTARFRWSCNPRTRRPASCNLVGRRRRLSTLCAFAPGRDTAANSLKLPEGEYGMPVLGESLEWIRDMPTFFNSRQANDNTLADESRTDSHIALLAAAVSHANIAV